MTGKTLPKYYAIQEEDLFQILQGAFDVAREKPEYILTKKEVQDVVQLLVSMGVFYKVKFMHEGKLDQEVQNDSEYN